MKKIIDFLSSHGIYLMMGGFVLALSGVIVLMLSKNHMWGPVVQTTAFSAALIGFIFYVIGRIFVAAKRQKYRKNHSTSLSSKD